MRKTSASLLLKKALQKLERQTYSDDSNCESMFLGHSLEGLIHFRSSIDWVPISSNGKVTNKQNCLVGRNLTLKNCAANSKTNPVLVQHVDHDFIYDCNRSLCEATFKGQQINLGLHKYSGIDYAFHRVSDR